MPKHYDNPMLQEADNAARTLEWCRGMMEIIIEKEKDCNISNALEGVLRLIERSQHHAENVIKFDNK